MVAEISYMFVVELPSYSIPGSKCYFIIEERDGEKKVFRDISVATGFLSADVAEKFLLKEKHKAYFVAPEVNGRLYERLCAAKITRVIHAQNQDLTISSVYVE